MSESRSRFDGIARLYGSAGLRRLATSHVCVVGIGGVGSWTAEALARSGVGRLTLVDMDDVCVSNVNRQVPAVETTIGRPKVEAMADRVRAINPRIEVEAVAEYFSATTAEELLNRRYDAVVDAIDDVANKALLIARAHAGGLPLVTTGAAGGRRDPTRIECADLAVAHHDRLLQSVRRRLRREFGFPPTAEVRFGISAVFSSEPVPRPKDRRPTGNATCIAGLSQVPAIQIQDSGDDTVTPTLPGGSLWETAGPGYRLNCDFGYGSAAFVTGVFGFVAAGEAVRLLVHGKAKPPNHGREMGP